MSIAWFTFWFVHVHIKIVCLAGTLFNQFRLIYTCISKDTVLWRKDRDEASGIRFITDLEKNIQIIFIIWNLKFLILGGNGIIYINPLWVNFFQEWGWHTLE